MGDVFLLLVFLAIGSSSAQFSQRIFSSRPQWERSLETIYEGELRECRNSHRQTSICRRLLQNSLENNSSSLSDRIASYRNHIYMVEAEIGTPSATFLVALDTGSRDIFLINQTCQWIGTTKTCEPKEDVKRHWKKYEPTLSFNTSYVPGNDTYGSGKVVGIRANETVRVGPFRLLQQDFLLADKMSESLATFAADGLLGMSYPRKEDARVPPLSFIENARHTSLHPLEKFTIFLGRNEEVLVEDAGTLTWNAMDIEHCSSYVTWVPLTHVDDDEFNPWNLWMHLMTSFKYGEVEEEEDFIVSTDTGASFIAGPFEQVEAFLKTLNYTRVNSTNYAPCDTPFPSLFFTISGVAFEVPPHQYVLKDSYGCGVAVDYFPVEKGRPEWLLGAPFLRTVCTTHHVVEQKIGFATLKK